IAQRGTLLYHDPVVAAVPPFARDLFVPQDTSRPGFVAPRFMGFFVLDPDRGTVVSQFPHLFPASIAIGYGLAGLNGARWAAPVAGLLLGLLLFLRIDALVPLAGILTALALATVAGARIRWTFAVPLAAASALLVPYATGPLREYFARPIAFVANLGWGELSM